MGHLTVNNCFQSLHRGAYFVQQKICNLTSTECKVNSLFVLGRVLQATSVIASVASFGLVVLTPLSLIGLVPALIAGVFGTVIAESPRDVLDVVLLEPPFIQGQPIGLVNSGNNCWLNSSMQMLLNTPSLFQKVQRIPALAAFQQTYEQERQAGQKIARHLDVQHLREYFSERTGGQISPRHIQEDSAGLFEYLFQGDNALHTLYQQIDQEPLRVRREPMILVDFNGQTHLPFQELFNQYFDLIKDTGHRVRLSFERAPEDLLIQAKRFTQERDPLSGRMTFGKNNDPIAVQPTLALGPSHLQSGENVQYSCDAFCVHYGATLQWGHYVAYVKRGDTWWYVSDQTQRPISMKDVSEAMKHGYIFHYKKA